MSDRRLFKVKNSNVLWQTSSVAWEELHTVEGTANQWYHCRKGVHFLECRWQNWTVYPAVATICFWQLMCERQQHHITVLEGKQYHPQEVKCYLVKMFFRNAIHRALITCIGPQNSVTNALNLIRWLHGKSSYLHSSANIGARLYSK